MKIFKNINVTKRQNRILLYVALTTIVFGFIIFFHNYFEKNNELSWNSVLDTIAISFKQPKTYLLLSIESMTKLLLFYKFTSHKVGSAVYAVPVLGLFFSLWLHSKYYQHVYCVDITKEKNFNVS